MLDSSVEGCVLTTAFCDAGTAENSFNRISIGGTGILLSLLTNNHLFHRIDLRRTKNFWIQSVMFVMIVST